MGLGRNCAGKQPLCCSASPWRWGALDLRLPPAFVLEETRQVLIVFREAPVTAWVRLMKGFRQAPPAFLLQGSQGLIKAPS